MKKKFFTKKNRILCLVWSFIGIILLCSVFAADFLKDAALQNLIGNIVTAYVFGSCVLSGYAAYLTKKEKNTD